LSIRIPILLWTALCFFKVAFWKAAAAHVEKQLL
jgi:hypothetical protein